MDTHKKRKVRRYSQKILVRRGAHALALCSNKFPDLTSLVAIAVLTR